MMAICVGHSTFDTTLPMNEYPTENTKNRVERHIECGGGPASMEHIYYKNGGCLLLYVLLLEMITTEIEL